MICSDISRLKFIGRKLLSVIVVVVIVVVAVVVVIVVVFLRQ